MRGGGGSALLHCTARCASLKYIQLRAVGGGSVKAAHALARACELGFLRMGGSGFEVQGCVIPVRGLSLSSRFLILHAIPLYM